MNEKEIIIKNLHRYFEAHENRRVVVLPFRNMSGMVSDLLKAEYDIQEQFIVDNNVYDMEHIYPMNNMPDYYRECVFFLAAFGNTKKVLQEQLLNYVTEEQIVDLMYDEEREKVFESDSKVHLDFMCPGFMKCGTTSLYRALAQNPKIFLPAIKETYFLRYSVNEESHEKFRNQYKEEDVAGKLVGEIEPAYRGHAEDIYRYFGDGLKLIFCVRNPIETLYSYFKMEMRIESLMLDSEVSGEQMMEGFEHVTPQMFDGWAKKYRYRGVYTDFIKMFMKYYPIEQMKIMVSEDLYTDAHDVMDDLQDFIGISAEDKLEYREFPRENIGSKVAKDQRGLEINIGIGQLSRRLRRQGDVQSLSMLQSIREKIEEFTLVEYNEPMLESTRRELLDFYMDSIWELEGMLGRSLKGVWY